MLQSLYKRIYAHMKRKATKNLSFVLHAKDLYGRDFYLDTKFFFL